MQRLDPRKRSLIVAAAARLFARAPYHQVRLDDVAAAARVGKGTLYLYFKDKDELFASLLADGFGEVVAGLRARWTAGLAPWALIDAAVRELTAFALANPALFEVIKPGEASRPARLERARESLRTLLGEAVRAGVQRGEFLPDRHPELTGMFFLGAIRVALLCGPKGLGQDGLAEHILRVLGGGIRRPAASGVARTRKARH